MSHEEIAALRQQRDAAVAECERLRGHIATLNEWCEKYNIELAALRTQRDGLLKYAKHDHECDANPRYTPRLKCTCGLDAALAGLAAVQPEGEAGR